MIAQGQQCAVQLLRSKLLAMRQRSHVAGGTSVTLPSGQIATYYVADGEVTRIDAGDPSGLCAACGRPFEKGSRVLLYERGVIYSGECADEAARQHAAALWDEESNRQLRAH